MKTGYDSAEPVEVRRVRPSAAVARWVNVSFKSIAPFTDKKTMGVLFTGL